MKSEFFLAVTQLANERGLPKEKVIAAVEAALASAFKKDNMAAGHNITVRLNPSTGEVKVYALKEVVEEVTDPKKEASLEEARRLRPDAQIGDTVEIEMPHLQISGRIIAQTARQVIMQKLREAERDLILEEFSRRVGELVSGRIERMEGGNIIVHLGRAEAVLPREEQVPTERYRIGQTMKFYLVQVRRTPRNTAEVVLSRTHPNLLKRLLEIEVPEIYNGIVEVRAIAREPGSRSKVAVAARQEGVDPVGSCVGLRGVRIQAIVNELQGERVDVLQWHKDPAIFIANALSPAQTLRVELNQEEKSALVVVPDRMLSLAIGREGQNARLAAKLTGWKIEIKSQTEYEEMLVQREAQAREAEEAVATAQEGPAQVAVEAPPEEAPTPVASEAGEEAPLPAEEPALELPELEEPVTAEEEEAEEEEEEVAFSEEIWSLPQVVSNEPSAIRFAEDIMPERYERARRKRRKGEKARPKKGKRARPVPAEEELGDLE